MFPLRFPRVMISALVSALLALSAAACDAGPDAPPESEQGALKIYNPPGSTNEAMYTCALGTGSSCGFVIPSLASFCGDVGPDTATRWSTSTLRVAFKFCPHVDDWGCSAWNFRSPASDGAIAEVRVQQGNTQVTSYRVKASHLTTANCPTGRWCAYLTTGSATYNTVSATPISGASRNPDAKPTTSVLISGTTSATKSTSSP